MNEKKESDSISTMLCHYAEEQLYGPVVPPIYQNSLFTFETWEDIERAFENRLETPIYTRGIHPGTRITERKLAQLCHAEDARLFASGMAAISAAILSCVKTGDHVICVKNVYGPTMNFLSVYLKEKLNLELTFVAGERISDFSDNIRSNTSLIYLESPASVVLCLQDLRAIAGIAKAKGIKTVIDNTWATPLYQTPLKLGIDMEVHSCSKYLSGHSDLVLGMIASDAETIRKLHPFEIEQLGAKVAPFESWLLLRSLRTLPLRMERHAQSGMAFAEHLERHPKVEKVYYPGLKSFSQHELARKQMIGFTGLMSFNLATEDLSKLRTFLNTLKYFKIGISWGGHESLVYAPAISYLKELSPERFQDIGIRLSTIRVSIGLEDVRDLIADFENALRCSGI
ncbi:MAG: aminotransferase class I/II-fold pyridoxal phosphate-dependent enzyme [Spirochaetota bacterium]